MWFVLGFSILCTLVGFGAGSALHAFFGGAGFAAWSFIKLYLGGHLKPVTPADGATHERS